MFQRAVDENLVELGFEALFEAVAKSSEPDRLGGHFLLAELAGFAEADDASHVERSGAHTALVAAPIDNGRELHARVTAANVKCANALGAVNLVAADGQHVDVVLLHVDRNLAN